MDDILVLPTGPLAGASLALVRSTESRPIADHSIRSFIFARLLAEHEGALNDAAYDEELLFAAAVMHDLGLGEHAQGQARFEVEGADLAAEVLWGHDPAARMPRSGRIRLDGASNRPRYGEHEPERNG